MHARKMFGLKNCRIARMSSGHHCLIRDLGLVKGGKGLRHHEVLIAFSVQAALKRIRQADFPLRRFSKNRKPRQKMLTGSFMLSPLWRLPHWTRLPRRGGQVAALVEDRSDAGSAASGAQGLIA
jgi:hypothetical protein